MLRFENHVLIKVALLASIIIVALSQQINAATSSTGLLKKAHALLEQDQDKAALACLNSLISKEPNNALAYSERSLANAKVENYDKALADSNKAITLNPKLAIAYANRAAIYIVTERYQKALEDSNKAIALAPRLARAYSMRALVYERQKNYQKEIEQCNKALAIDSKSSIDYTYRATAFRQLGQYQSALQDCNKALSLTPKKAATYIERGYIYFCLRKFQKAVEDYSVAIKISPRSYKEYSLRAGAYGELGQYRKQIDDLTSAIKVNPKVADLYERRADAYYQLGQLQNAIDDCTTATSLNPASPYAYDTAAWAYEELGLYDKAIELRTKDLGLEAKDAFEWFNRGEDYELLGKFDLARADRQKAIELFSPSERLSMQGCKPLIDFNHPSVERPRDIIDRQLKSNSVVLSFHYDNGGHICVPVQVNGHPLQLMLDTGCAHSDLWKQAMPGVAKMDKVQLRGTKADGKESLSGFFRARDLKLDTLTLPNVAMGVNDGLVGHKTLSGFLGGNILENFVVTVDYTKKQVILATSSQQDITKKAITVPMRIRKHHPICSVRLDGKLDVMALLDTGCPCSMSPDSLLKPILPKKLACKEHMSGPWLGNLSVENVRLKSVGLGASNLEAPIFDVFPADEAPAAATEITLGNDFLSRFKTVTFDYPARRIILEPNDTVLESAPYLYCEGRFYFQHNKMGQALDAFSKSMILDNEFAQACYYYRATAFVLLKQYQQAILDLNALIKLDPKESWAYRNRAWAYDKLGKHQLAKRDRRMAKKFSRK